MHTVEQLSSLLKVKEHTVLAWIASGELRAVNVGRAPGKLRPRWRVTQASLDAFLAARTGAVEPTPVRAARRPKTPDVVTFYA